MKCIEKNCGIKLRKYAYYVMFNTGNFGPFCLSCGQFKGDVFDACISKVKIKKDNNKPIDKE